MSVDSHGLCAGNGESYPFSIGWGLYKCPAGSSQTFQTLDAATIVPSPSALMCVHVCVCPTARTRTDHKASKTDSLRLLPDMESSLVSEKMPPTGSASGSKKPVSGFWVCPHCRGAQKGSGASRQWSLTFLSLPSSLSIRMFLDSLGHCVTLDRSPSLWDPSKRPEQASLKKFSLLTLGDPWPEQNTLGSGLLRTAQRDSLETFVNVGLVWVWGLGAYIEY